MAIYLLIFLLKAFMGNTFPYTQYLRPDIAIVQIANKKIVSEEFLPFYSRFHNDTSFQLSRIKFPLEGINVVFDPSKGLDMPIEEKWTIEKWKYFRIPYEKIDVAEFKKQRMVSDKLVIEKIWIEDSDFIIEIRYSLIKDKWYLVYYYNQTSL